MVLGSIPPRTVWKPQPYWLIAGWLGFVKLPAPGEYTIPSPEQNAFHIHTNPTNRGRNWLSPRTIPAQTVWKPQLRVHHYWLGSVKPAITTHWGQEGSASSLTMIYFISIINCKVVVHSTWITIYDLRLAQPNSFVEDPILGARAMAHTHLHTRSRARTRPYMRCPKRWIYTPFSTRSVVSVDRRTRQRR